MNVGQGMYVVSMQAVMILMAATGVSACLDSREMATTVQVSSVAVWLCMQLFYLYHNCRYRRVFNTE